MTTKKPAATGFDAEVDSARKRLEASLNEDTGFDDLAALQALAPILSEKISSRRLAFTLGDEDDDETQIIVLHVETDEELGFIFAEDGEYVFESNLEAYFDDFVDDDPERFVERLYETLRADLPKYEVEHKG
ncbi:hypothetical protein [Candidatus Viadribacter manganicus]|uniref:Uncharacterized protein n=1 Tax=Candidatus Viadribacter manganicus TaxID=1759059 RepID=A0A1B1AM35_9PROT|nr:hypothetical protein [Candidatus Viadribacter manganicus]ANP47601.1 hypothetical protein ATE48_17705 [Candidatus Viadribacter manganicus]